MNRYVVLPLLFSGGILVHHRYKHAEDERLDEFEKWFQFDDVRNHETWALFLFGIGITAYIFQTRSRTKSS